MKPIDLRNATWNEICETLCGRRLAAYEAWQQWGPGTTHEVAERSGMSVLTLRPRTTELCQLGFVALCGDVACKEGIYAAVPEDIALERFTAARAGQQQGAAQLPLQLTA